MKDFAPNIRKNVDRFEHDFRRFCAREKAGMVTALWQSRFWREKYGWFLAWRTSGVLRGRWRRGGRRAGGDLFLIIRANGGRRTARESWGGSGEGGRAGAATGR